MKTIKLFAAPECWQFRDKHPDQWKNFACGPGEVGDYLVPDVILGIPVAECCRIHDWYYRFDSGKTEEDRAAADRIFLNNMLRTVNALSKNSIMKRIRSRIALIYYNAVRRYGAPVYFEERNSDIEYKEV